MIREHRHRVAVVSGLIVLAVLAWLTALRPPGLSDLLPAFLFCALTVFTTTFGVPLAGGSVSLLPMTSIAAYLVMGLVPAGWVAFVGALIHGLVRFRWGWWLEGRQEVNLAGLAALTAANGTMHAGSILVGGVVFELLGGVTPLAGVSGANLLPLILLGLAYLGVNYLIAGAYIAARGREPLRHYLRSLPNMVFYEGGPLLFAPLMALILTRLGLGQFVLFALILVAASLITRNLALTSRRLERRVRELDSLQAVGQALSASLHIETVLSAIYEQVVRLMEARNFYVALYDPETDEVSFPLAVEDGERVRWRSRRAGNGLTEYILRTRAPLLIPRDVEATVKRLGLDHIGRPAACWLGVPILAGDEPLGVIAVQSYSAPESYDISHQEVLVIIAAQAAAAIQNARLYARTDEALARRVQELDSILRTTREGVLLLDADWRVVAVNRALADILGVAQSELAGQRLTAPRFEDEQPLTTLIGYEPSGLRADCEALARGEQDRRRVIIPLGPQGRHIERTLTPVRDREGTITGWLLVFRDVTEEIELARLKEDMTYMLVHDLRSPLAVLKGSMVLLEESFADRDAEDFGRLVSMARRNTERILRMVNELLDIGKLESGQLRLRPEEVEAEVLLSDIAVRLAPLATSAHIALEVEASPDLPSLYVDRDFIGRALENLVDNAIKFTPNGGRVRLWARLDPEQSGTMLIGVSDSGPGIPPEERPRLFKKFQQATSNTGRRVGTGLGLPFCKLVVEAHGGRVWVESKVGEGSTFVMRLPVVE